MTLIAEESRVLRKRLHAHATPDHDLPMLAIEQQPHVQIEWEVLMGNGVLPALILGAERRLQGRR